MMYYIYKAVEAEGQAFVARLSRKEDDEMRLFLKKHPRNVDSHFNNPFVPTWGINPGTREYFISLWIDRAGQLWRSDATASVLIILYGLISTAVYSATMETFSS